MSTSRYRRGIFAYIIDDDPGQLQNAIEITLQRFTEYHSLQGAFGRRAVIEQAKGILMARHAITAEKAFEMLREHSQHTGRKLIDVAQSGRRQPPAAAADATCQLVVPRILERAVPNFLAEIQTPPPAGGAPPRPLRRRPGHATAAARNQPGLSGPLRRKGRP